MCGTGALQASQAAHRDRAFENLYLVSKGAKRFLLLPPTAPAWLPVASCVSARWTKADGSRRLVDDEPEQLVDWLDVPSLAATEPAPAVADVRPGLLYPALASADGDNVASMGRGASEI